MAAFSQSSIDCGGALSLAACPAGWIVIPFDFLTSTGAGEAAGGLARFGGVGVGAAGFGVEVEAAAPAESLAIRFSRIYSIPRQRSRSLFGSSALTLS